MTLVIKRMFVLALLVPLTACGIFGSDEEEVTEEELQAVAVESKVPVQSVARVEIGRTRNGYLISAFGTAPGLGYALPELRVRRSGRPAADGFLEFDFVAQRPDARLKLPPGTTRTRSIRADLPVTTKDLRGTRGIRVLSVNGGVQVAIGTGGQ